MENKDNHKESMEGIVTARKCDCCGHHEIGVMTQNGEYVRLRLGMRIIMISSHFKNSEYVKGNAKADEIAKDI